MVRCMFQPLLLLFFLTFCSHESHAIILTRGNRFVDVHGRTVILRGFNVAGNSKVPDFRPLKNPDTDLAGLKRFGVNVIRLLFIWEAYEPCVGVYDVGYLRYYRKVVEEASHLGIYVIVDIHQDAFSRYTLHGCGEGFPKWALPPSLSPAEPLNTPTHCAGWGQAALTNHGVKTAFTAFFNNVNGVKSRYLDLLENLASALKDLEAVIGIDLLNEPVGNEVEEITPMYEEAAKKLQAAGFKGLLFLCPAMARSSGFAISKLAKPAFTNAVFSPHFYNAFNLYGGYDFGALTRRALRSYEKLAKEWNVPLFLGEFGFSQRSLPEVFAKDVYSYLDENCISGTQWVFTPGWNKTLKDGWNGEDYSVVVNNGSSVRSFPFLPSPRRVAGVPLLLKHSPGCFYFRWKQDVSIEQPTVIYVPRSEYFGESSEVVLDFSPGISCTLVDMYTLTCKLKSTIARLRLVQSRIMYVGLCRPGHTLQC